jgi:glycosyltransferase involved in cell wall biosynthesis
MVLPAVSKLPDLARYREEFCRGGTRIPLPLCTWKVDGLLDTIAPLQANREGWPWTLQTKPFAKDAHGWPKISIVTPSFRQAAYLEETLRSLLLQNYPALEVVVLDAGSTDGSDKIIEYYRPFLSFARIAPDRGQSHAINQGFSLASGDIFAWLNSDDFLMPDALRRVGECFRDHQPDLVYGDIGDLHQDASVIEFAPARFVHTSQRKYGGLLHQSSTFWSAKKHIPLIEELQCSMDYDLWVRLLPEAKLRYLPAVLSIARRHFEAKTISASFKDAWQRDAALNGKNYPGLYVSSPFADFISRIAQRVTNHLRMRRRKQVDDEIREWLYGLR